MGAAVSISFGLLFAYLRLRLPAESSTRGQRWALSILAWTFLLNGLIVAVAEGWILGGEARWAIIDHMNVVIPLLILFFGIIYPRPGSGRRRFGA